MSLGGIKDVEGLKRIKVGAMLPRLLPASISLWAGAKFSVPDKKSKERFTLKLLSLVMSGDSAETKCC